MLRTASITTLRENLSTLITSLTKKGPVMVLRRSEPAAYLVSTELFTRLIELVEDLEDLRDGKAAIEDYRRGQNMMDTEVVFAELGL